MLWEPVIDGARYMQELLRINLSTQLAVYGSVKQDRRALVESMKTGSHANVDGYLISSQFYTQSIGINLLDIDLTIPEAKLLVTQIAQNLKQKDHSDLLRLVSKHATAEFLKVEEPRFWREVKPFTSRPKSLIRETMNWLENSIVK